MWNASKLYRVRKLHQQQETAVDLSRLTESPSRLPICEDRVGGGGGVRGGVRLTIQLNNTCSHSARAVKTLRSLYIIMCVSVILKHMSLFGLAGRR